MENLEKVRGELTKNNISVLIFKGTKYVEDLGNILKILSEKHSAICYVSANKPEGAIKEMLASNKIDESKFLIIDAVTKKIPKEEKGHESTIFLQSPSNLTKLSLVIKKVLDQIEIVFIDSLSTLLVYGGEMVTIRFAHDLISKLRESKKRCAFVILGEEVSSNLINDLSMFVDGVIELEENGEIVKDSQPTISETKTPKSIKSQKQIKV